MSSTSFATSHITTTYDVFRGVLSWNNRSFELGKNVTTGDFPAAVTPITKCCDSNHQCAITTSSRSACNLVRPHFRPKEPFARSTRTRDSQAHNRRSTGVNLGGFLAERCSTRFGNAKPGSQAQGQRVNERSRTDWQGAWQKRASRGSCGVKATERLPCRNRDGGRSTALGL
jgi:hypothetical protein